MATEINLLPRRDKRESNILKLVIILGVLLLALLVIFSVQYRSLNTQVEKLSTIDTQLLSEQAEKNTMINELNGSNQDYFSTSLDFIEQISYPVTPIIQETETHLDENAYLISYSFSESNVLLTVDFETLSDVARYVDLLTTSEMFSDVKMNRVSKFTLDGEETVDFQVIPRHSVEIDLSINKAYLGGGI